MIIIFLSIIIVIFIKMLYWASQKDYNSEKNRFRILEELRNLEIAAYEAKTKEELNIVINNLTILYDNSKDFKILNNSLKIAYYIQGKKDGLKLTKNQI